MRRPISFLLALALLAGLTTLAWGVCNSVGRYAASRPGFFFSRPSSAALAAERARQREYYRQKTLARIAGMKSREEQTRARVTEKRRDALEEQFARAYDWSPEQREAEAEKLYERGVRSERAGNIEAAQDYYVFALQLSPGGPAADKAHEALKRLAKVDDPAKTAARAQGERSLLTESELEELKRGGSPGSAPPVENETVEQMLEQLVNFPDPRKQLLVIERLRDAKGAAYSEGLVRAIDMVEGEARDTARAALVERFTRMTADTLRSKLASDAEEAQVAAASAAARKKGRELVPDLIARLTDPSDRVRSAATAALKQLTGQDFGPAASASKVEQFTAQQRWEKWWASQGGQ